MDNLTIPETSRLNELREKAVDISRKSREFPAPLPVIISAPGCGVDPDADDNIASQALSSLYNSEKYSDLTVKCQDRLWRAHRAVVCSQSKVLAACVDGSFRESLSGEIDLSEDEPEIVEHMISYLYRGFYDFVNPIPAVSHDPAEQSAKEESSPWWKRTALPTPRLDPFAFSNADLTPQYVISQSSLITKAGEAPSQQQNQIHGRVAPTPSRLITHASLYCMGDQYDIPRLKNHALCKYAALAPTAWKSPFFIPSLKLIYSRTPSRHPEIDDLRAVASKVAAEHIQDLLGKIEFLEICTADGELATDILKMTLVLRKLEIKVNWKQTVSCAVNPKHELVYIPSLVGFGMANGASGMGGGTSVAMQGFGSTSGGKYKCIPCGRYL